MINLKKYKDRKELEEFCKELYMTNLALQNRIKSQDERLTSAEELLKNMPTEQASEDDLKALLLREVAYMDKLSKSGGLNSDETKQLKLVVDSYVALERKNQSPVDKPKRKPTTKNASELISIVKDFEKEQ